MTKMTGHKPTMPLAVFYFITIFKHPFLFLCKVPVPMGMGCHLPLCPAKDFQNVSVPEVDTCNRACLIVLCYVSFIFNVLNSV